MKRLTITFLTGLLVAAGALFAGVSVSYAQTISGPRAGERAKVAEYLQKGDLSTAQKLMQELQSSMLKNSHAAQQDFNTFFEQIRGCGFYPQETRLECTIDIKQVGGYAGPIGSPGSTEYVYFCVDLRGAGLEPVGMGNLQMHDESGGSQPPWQYAVYRDFNPLGGVRTTNTGAVANTSTNGPTRNARAILSWFVAPTDCNFNPFWGNVVNFRIRFDPVR